MKNQFNNFDTKLNPDGPLRVESVKIERLPDNDFDPAEYLCADPSHPESEKARLNAYYRGDWHGVGIRAIAVISYPIGQGSRQMQTITSGGLWGVESDSGEDYFAEVAKEELINLQYALGQLGLKVTIEELQELAEKGV